MSNQAQCPNCGGYKVSSSTTPITQKTPISSSNRIIIAVICLVMIGNGLYVITTPGADVIGVVYSVPLILGLFGLFKVLFQPTHMKKVGDFYHFVCLLCGYHWEWREGQPRPKVNVRPEFLAKMEAQRWKCIACGNENEGSESSCRYCHYPKMN